MKSWHREGVGKKLQANVTYRSDAGHCAGERPQKQRRRCTPRPFVSRSSCSGGLHCGRCGFRLYMTCLSRLCISAVRLQYHWPGVGHRIRAVSEALSQVRSNLLVAGMSARGPSTYYRHLCKQSFVTWLGVSRTVSDFSRNVEFATRSSNTACEV